MLLQLYAKIGSPLILLSEDSIDEELSMGVCIKISQNMWQIYRFWNYSIQDDNFCTEKSSSFLFHAADEDHKVCRKA